MLIAMKMIGEVPLEGKDYFNSLRKNVEILCFRDFDEDDLVEGVAAVTLQDVESRLIQLDPSIQDTMWYV
jgi:hypothetical protein